ncbi:hypothetical protein ABB02_01292 [Clostridiaceae bacterium JG1575]|nr:hypothetical protein ABB02_01292 [Clostridiaceae bacterium JG1575]
MANLDQLTAQILADAQAQADEIIAKAQAQAEELIAKGAQQTDSRKSALMARAQNEAELMRERIVSGTALRIRDEKLKAKGQIIDRVMTLVAQQLKELPDETLLDYMKKDLAGHSFAPGERLMVREGLEEKAKALWHTVPVEGRKGLSGYILDCNGVMENHSFETSLDYQREDLEQRAAHILFES